ncbi:hypothetical protein IAT40_000968 [Kwoniella sp. CBS 6097]
MTLPGASAITSAHPAESSIHPHLAAPHHPASSVSVPVSNLVASPHLTSSSKSDANSSNSKGKGRAEEPLAPGGFGSGDEAEVEGSSDGDERSDREVSDTDGTDGEDDDDYEEKRQQRIRENQLILANLGIQSSSSIPNANNAAAGPSSPPPAPAPRRRKTTSDAPIYDRSGYIISLPAPGQTHTIACVEMPSDRKLKRRILEGEYTDCFSWSKGEERRWKIGRGKGGDLPPEEPWYLGGVGRDFRWRKWKGLEKELRREMRLSGELNDRDIRPVVETAVVPEGVSAYSLIPGQACHQCRRKSEKRKMKCRNVNPVCNATFCETCCKRYSYFDFDEESRSFICPLCKDICNCSNCIRKRNLAHLLDGKSGVKRSSIKNRMGTQAQGEMTVQAWLEQAVKENRGAPFDCVRLVDQAYDIITPDLPPEAEVSETIVVSKPVRMKLAKKKKKKVQVMEGTATEGGEQEQTSEKPKRGRPKKLKQGDAQDDGDAEEKPKAKRGRPKKVVDDEEMTNSVQKKGVKRNPSNANGLVIKLKIPKATDIPTTPTLPEHSEHSERVKEVDSDGDTVGDWSSDGSTSRLTSLSSHSPVSPAPPPRLPFPPRPDYSQTNSETNHLLNQPRGYPTLFNPSPGQVHHSSQPVYISTRMDDGAVQTSPFRSSPESGDDPDQPTPKRRKKPPPKANIVRAPRHSFSHAESSPLEAQYEPPSNNVVPVLVEQTYSGGYQKTTTPEGLPPTKAVSLLSPSHDQRQYQLPDPGSITLPAFSKDDHTVHLPALSGTHTYPTFEANLAPSSASRRVPSQNFWQPRSSLRQHNDDTLSPGPEPPQILNRAPGRYGEGSSEIPSMAMPMSYSYSHGEAEYTSAYESTYHTHRPSMHGTHLGTMIGGPPPYSHSPTRRPVSLSDGDGMERQYLTLAEDRSPLSSSSNPQLVHSNGASSPLYAIPAPRQLPGPRPDPQQAHMSTTLAGPYSSLSRPANPNATPMDYSGDLYGPPLPFVRHYDRGYAGSSWDKSQQVDRSTDR